MKSFLRRSKCDKSTLRKVADIFSQRGRYRPVTRRVVRQEGTR